MDKATPPIKAIIGLGNPAPEYQKTYHNIGRIFVEYYASQESKFLSFQTPSRKHFEFASDDVLLIKPLIFMNESGRAVKEAADFLKLNSENILIAHDDSDMTLGNYKLVFDQSSAGHKGVQSIIDTLGTQKFWRLKIGIRPVQEKVRQKAEKFVLKKISKKYFDILASVFDQAMSEMAQ